MYFDGVCGLCNRSVDLLIRLDRRGVLRFAPLQGTTAAQHLPPQRIADLDSFVLTDATGTHFASTAVLRALEHLGGPWRMIALLRAIPLFLRETIYRWVARNRYKWFGRLKTCRLPSPGEQERFLP